MKVGIGKAMNVCWCVGVFVCGNMTCGFPRLRLGVKMGFSFIVRLRANPSKTHS